VRTLALLTLPLGVAGLKSNLVYFITFVVFSEVGTLGTGTGTGGGGITTTSTQLKTLVPVILLNALAPAEVDTKDFDPALNTQELKLPFHAED